MFGGDVAFIASETDGKWGTAFEPPVVTRNANGKDARVTTVSCALRGDCSAGGYDVDSSGKVQGFLVDEVRGKWQPALKVPGTLQGSVSAISCSAPGECSAGGQFVRDTAPRTAGVVTNEIHGVWGPAIAVTGMQAVSTYGVISAISCGAPGDCGAGGWIYGTGPSAPPVGVVTDEHPAAPPKLIAISPASGRASGGTTVVVRGRGLGDALTVVFGDVPGRNLRSISPTSVVVTSPPGAGIVNLTVVAQAGISATTTHAHFTYLSPAIRRLTPSHGPSSGGLLVTIYGSDFTGAKLVRFGHRVGTDLRVINPDAIRVRTPSGSGTVNVRVTTPDGTTTITLNDRFTYR
jgi:hypothetical protein